MKLQIIIALLGAGGFLAGVCIGHAKGFKDGVRFVRVRASSPREGQ